MNHSGIDPPRRVVPLLGREQVRCHSATNSGSVLVAILGCGALTGDILRGFQLTVTA